MSLSPFLGYKVQRAHSVDGDIHGRSANHPAVRFGHDRQRAGRQRRQQNRPQGPLRLFAVHRAVRQGFVAGKWRRPRNGRSVAVRAVRQGAGRPRAFRALATLLQEGNFRTLAQPCSRRHFHRPHLPADRARRQIRRVQMRKGGVDLKLF